MEKEQEYNNKRFIKSQEEKDGIKHNVYTLNPFEFGQILVRDFIQRNFYKKFFYGKGNIEQLKEYYRTQKDKRTIDGFIAILNFITTHYHYIRGLFFQNMYNLEFFDKIYTLFSLAFKVKELDKFSFETFILKPTKYGFNIKDIKEDFDLLHFADNLAIMQENIKKIVAYNEIIKIFFRKYEIQKDTDIITFNIQRQYDKFYNIYRETTPTSDTIAKIKKNDFIIEKIFAFYSIFQYKIKFEIAYDNRQRFIRKANRNFDFMDIDIDLIDFILRE